MVVLDVVIGGIFEDLLLNGVLFNGLVYKRIVFIKVNNIIVGFYWFVNMVLCGFGVDGGIKIKEDVGKIEDVGFERYVFFGVNVEGEKVMISVCIVGIIC